MSRPPAPPSPGRPFPGTKVAHPLADRTLAGADWATRLSSSDMQRGIGHIRVALVGKGGAGKTTIAGALARALALQGRLVLAVDAARQADLASVLPLDPLQDPVPKESAEGQPPGAIPKTDAAPGLRPRTWGGGQLLTVLEQRGGGSPGDPIRKRLAPSADAVLIDCGHGLDDLDADLLCGLDLVLAVIDPGQRSVASALALRETARSLGIARVHSVVCGYRDRSELLRVRCRLDDWPPIAAFPYDERIRAADLVGTLPPLGGDFLGVAESLATHLIELSKALVRFAPA